MKKLTWVIMVFIVGGLLLMACRQAVPPTPAPEVKTPVVKVATPTPEVKTPVVKVATPAPKVKTPVVKEATPITKANWEQKWESLVNNAKKEGSVTIYGSLSPPCRQGLAKSFKEKFGIDIEYTAGTGAEITNKLLTERRGGIYNADVIITGTTTLISYMKKENVLEPIPPILVLPEVTNPKVWRNDTLPFVDKDCTALAVMAHFHHGIVRNTEVIKEGTLKSFKDLLKPEWKAKIILYDPTISGPGNNMVAVMIHWWGLEEAKAFLRKLVEQEVAITRDPRLQTEWCARGKYPILLAPFNDHIINFMKEGAPIAFVKMAEGGWIAPGNGALALPKNPQHPNATAVFVNWLLSQEGQAIFAELYPGPCHRIDVQYTQVPKELIHVPGVPVYVDTEEDLIIRESLRDLAKDILAPLLK